MLELECFLLVRRLREQPEDQSAGVQRRTPLRPMSIGGLCPALQYVSRPSGASTPYTTVAKRD